MQLPYPDKREAKFQRLLAIPNYLRPGRADSPDTPAERRRALTKVPEFVDVLVGLGAPTGSSGSTGRASTGETGPMNPMKTGI